MIDLATDALIALIKLTDRALSRLESVFRVPPPVGLVDGGTGPAAGDSIPPAAVQPVRGTSEIVDHLAAELFWAYDRNPPAVIRDLIAEARDRAAQFSAHGD